MFTLRALPRPGEDGNALLADYHHGLRCHWPAGRRLLARMLSAIGQGGWSPGERRLLSAAIREQGLSMRDRKGLHRLLNPAAFPFAANRLKNKQLFATVARDGGLPVADACDARQDDIARWIATRHDIIAKPSFRSKGQGVERYRRCDNGWAGPGGSIKESSLALRLTALWRTGGVIQQRLPTHRALADLSPGALPTLRIVTCLDEAGRPEACAIALRLSAGGEQPVDNFNAGNLVAGVDGEGRCGSAWMGGTAAPRLHDAHPVTGRAIAGTPVPDLADALLLALRAHRHFQSGFTVIGWDVGLTDGGPVLVEGNWNPGTDILQLVTGKGLAEMRLGALYRHHLAAIPAAQWRAARPVQWEARHG